MAKGTKKKAGAKSQMPKTFAGVKVPKEVRDVGSNIGSWLNTHLGREIIAEALVAAAAAAAIALRKNAPTAQQVSKAGKEAVETGTQAASNTKDLVQAAVGVVSDAVVGGVQKLLPSSDETPPVRRGRGRPKSVPSEAAADAAPLPRRRGPRAGRPAGATPGRPRKQRPADDAPAPAGDKD